MGALNAFRSGRTLLLYDLLLRLNEDGAGQNLPVPQKKKGKSLDYTLELLPVPPKKRGKIWFTLLNYRKSLIFNVKLQNLIR